MKRFLTVAVITTIAIGGPSTAKTTLQAKVPGPDGQIAFARRVGEASPDIFIANPDGSHVQQVPLEEPAESFAIPVWSPDRTTLLISHLDRGENVPLEFPPATVKPDGSDFNIIVAHAEGSDVTDCPAWSANGARLLCDIGGFQGVPPGVGSIRSSDGGGFRRLTTNPYGTSDIPTDISPDGSRFVFMRFRLGGHPFKTQRAAIFVANVDGTGVRRVTPFGLPFPHFEFATAQWSPDGQEIISQTRHGVLFVVHLDGTGITMIPLETGSPFYFAFEPDWSPDGSQIVFGMFIGGQEDLYTANADGSDVVRITNTPKKLEVAPDWGPPLA